MCDVAVERRACCGERPRNAAVDQRAREGWNWVQPFGVCVLFLLLLLLWCT